MNLDQIFKNFEKLKDLILVDVMIDAYLCGSVNRISPEAPIPVVDIEKQENRL